MAPRCDLFISTAEQSGDLQGALLLNTLLNHYPDLQVHGIFGPKMRQFGTSPLFEMEELSVMGFSEVIPALPRLIKRLFTATDAILEMNPPLLLTIDAPDFHFRLAKRLKTRGFKGKMIHLVCPSVWAWKKNRIQQMEQLFDKLLTIFPFEPALFSSSTLPVSYVGNPSVESLDTLPYIPAFLSLFPGSRPSVIRRQLPIQLQAAEHIASQTGWPIAVSLANEKLRPLITSLLPNTVKIQEDSIQLMRQSHLAIATCGTVTLELALRAVPTVVTYALSPLNAFLAKHLLKLSLSFYSLPNILLQRALFPERLHKECCPSLIEKSALQLLQENEKIKEGKEELLSLLGSGRLFQSNFSESVTKELSKFFY